MPAAGIQRGFRAKKHCSNARDDQARIGTASGLTAKSCRQGRSTASSPIRIRWCRGHSMRPYGGDAPPKRASIIDYLEESVRN
jgi:hypothetical protein